MNKIEKAISENRNEWIVYANSELPEENIESIASKVGLAVSTVKSYVRKFAHLLDKAREIFDGLYFQKRRASRDYGNVIINNTTVNPKEKGHEWCYLFRFYDKNKELVCSKVGTTTRDVWKRLQEELRSKTYSDCEYAEIDRIYDCGSMPAEGLESRIRAEYIRKYPESFKKNDRFIKTLFDLDEIDTIVSNYLAVA